jgi:precorrin-2/cobalt-factor-2 C20-methyltransferase
MSEAGLGKFYGMGVGPGDPELVTLKAVRVLKECSVVFVPRSATGEGSRAREIASRYISPRSRVAELVFPMTRDPVELENGWRASVQEVAIELRSGRNAAFLTLGDPMLYSTYIYLLRGLKKELPELEVDTVPGVTSVSAAAALTGFPIGEGDEKVVIVPSSGDIGELGELLDRFDTLVLMKVARNLQGIIALLEDRGLLDRAVMVSRAGFPQQSIVEELQTLKGCHEDVGYLSTILIKAGK